MCLFGLHAIVVLLLCYIYAKTHSEENLHIIIRYMIIHMGTRSGVVVKALCYKPAGHGFDSRWCHCNFSVTLSFWSHYGPGVDSASNRYEYQVYFLRVKAAGA